MPVRVVRGRENPYPQHEYFKRVGSQQTEVNSPFASVYAGPLLFALPIPDKDANTVADEGADWRYALDFDGLAGGSDVDDRAQGNANQVVLAPRCARGDRRAGPTVRLAADR